MTSALVAGALVGIGLLLVVRGTVPTRTPLAAALERLQQGSGRSVTQASDDADLSLRLGRWLSGRDGADRLVSRSARRDLQVMARPIERHLTEKVLTLLVGIGIALSLILSGHITHLQLRGLTSVGLALGLAATGFFVPDLTLHTQAEERRRSFRYALGSFFDLVVIGLAGGGGVESALYDAAQIGEGWAYGQIQRALAASRLTRETPWAALGRVGRELGIAELEELAASVGLAGTEGARVRESLAAKAASLRSHELSQAEAEAQSASERMSLPVVLLFLGFLVFVGYPALDRIVTGL
jgi:Flp pilus assembly protein TadB